MSSATLVSQSERTSGSYVDNGPEVPPRNIILFGESGCGKSSIINMLAQSDIADTSSTAAGCTFQSQKYTIALGSDTLNIFDTVGLNEGRGGTVSSNTAISNLYKLVRKMQDGVNLLVYVIRGPRITESTADNYRMFFEGFCQRKVPIVLIVTGLENEDPMDAWWDRNCQAFKKYGMEFSGQACVTTFRGKRDEDGYYMFDREYFESKPKVFDLILHSLLDSPWKMESTRWFASIIKTLSSGLKPLVPFINSSTSISAILKSQDLDEENTGTDVGEGERERERETTSTISRSRSKKGNPFARALKGIFASGHPHHPPQSDPPHSRARSNTIGSSMDLSLTSPPASPRPERNLANRASSPFPLTSSGGSSSPPPTRPFRDEYIDRESFLALTDPSGLSEEDRKNYALWQVISPDAAATIPPPRNMELERSRVVHYAAQGSKHPATPTRRSSQSKSEGLPPKADRRSNKLLSPHRPTQPPPPPRHPIVGSSSRPTSPGPSRSRVPTVLIPGARRTGQNVTYAVPTDRIEYHARGVFIPYPSDSRGSNSRANRYPYTV
ncbi:hypothetical protein JAAARDRAFT_153927 [Jaapia argillacea MUCL 33604]|uniref:G domain-containing protein n=1 Tax=Jaapia argillacea MUCL 33604 TaxID=933084 RepID=A0A067Q8J6_9AGAM|nr:hypothetical protein JAAARDRAFT_153927 [Jaapia argillacea MUCL 33604]